jgi:hypothetical protein
VTAIDSMVACPASSCEGPIPVADFEEHPQTAVSPIDDEDAIGQGDRHSVSNTGFASREAVVFTDAECVPVKTEPVRSQNDRKWWLTPSSIYPRG